jgi:hypothetical protein
VNSDWLFSTFSGTAADEADAGIAHQCAGQQARFGQDLEAVAHAQHRHAAPGRFDHGLHDRRTRRHGARAQIVAIGKPAGNGDEIKAFGQAGVAVPHAVHRAAADLFHCHRHVAVAVRSGKVMTAEVNGIRRQPFRCDSFR